MVEAMIGHELRKCGQVQNMGSVSWKMLNGLVNSEFLICMATVLEKGIQE